MLAHDLVNKLSVIVGLCDLMTENIPGNPKDLRRISTIREIAKIMAKELTDHECQIDVAMREIAAKKSSTTLDSPSCR